MTSLTDRITAAIHAENGRLEQVGAFGCRIEVVSHWANAIADGLAAAEEDAAWDENARR